MRKPGSKSQPVQEALTRDEWDFTGIPQEELWIAEIYEYSREIEAVREAFNDWLECGVGIDMGDCPADFDPTWGKNIRDLMREYEIPYVMDDFSLSPITFDDLVEEACEPVSGHQLMGIMEVLELWPAPYKVARKSSSAQRGIRTFMRRNSPNTTVCWEEYQDSRFRRMTDYHVASIIIDLKATKAELKRDFGEMCAPLLRSKRGRKKDEKNPAIKLKQLAAHRLLGKGIGKGRTFASYERLEIELKELCSKKNDITLPLYADLKGFKDAARRGAEHSLRFNRYKKPKRRRSTDGMISYGPGFEWTDFPSSEQ